MKFVHTLLVAAITFSAPPSHAFWGELFGGKDDEATKQEQSSPDKAKTKTPTALGDAASESGTAGVPLATVGMADFATLWVPGGYLAGGSSKMFIGGVKFSAPGGYDHVEGFLPASYGYLVAVRQPTSSLVGADTPKEPSGLLLTQEMLAKMTPAQQLEALKLQMQMMQAQRPTANLAKPSSVANRPHTVFYKVSKTGEVLGMAAEVMVDQAASVWVTPKAIYVSVTATGDTRLIDVVGITPTGERLDGPQSVISALPGLDNSWYSYRLRMSGNTPVKDWYVTDGEGNSRVLEKGHAPSMHYLRNNVISPKHAFIDMPPITASAQTGIAMYVEFNNGRGPLGGAASGTLRTLNLGKNEYASYVGKHDVYDELLAAANRPAIFGTSAKPMYVGQAFSSSYKEPGTNIYVVNALDSVKDVYPLYQLRSRGSNILRGVLNSAAVNGDFFLDKSRDMFVITTPKTTVGIYAKLEGKGQRGFDLINKTAVDTQSIQNFVSKYAFTAN